MKSTAIEYLRHRKRRVGLGESNFLQLEYYVDYPIEYSEG